MAASNAPRVLLALLLALSVGIKIAGGNATRAAEEMGITKREVAAFLDRHGFRVVDGDEARADSPFLRAAVGTCRLLVVAAAPQGWHRDLVHRLASPRDQVFFVVGGTVYDDQPQWRTWAYHYWRLLNRFVGRRLAAQPILGIVASAACDLSGIPWRELAKFPEG